MSTTAKPSTAGHGFRADIEGLRAVAVLLVVANHLGWARGGFVGVDVFFVISGFLITGLLISEGRRTGRISFADFYRRRARRILPAALAVLIAVNVAARLLFVGSRVSSTATDSWWALGFLANVHFARIGTDYFNAALPPSLVQHFWSLAVEEQYYIVWPTVIALGLFVARHRPKARNLALRWIEFVLAGAFVASFVWAILETATHPTAAYFDTAARAWELAGGAGLAIASRALTRMARPIGTALFLAGVFGIGLSAVLINANSGFPAPAALLPVGATALLLASGSAGPIGRTALVVTNPPMRYIGRISYSMYLWHWPVILCCEALLPGKSPARTVLILSTILATSMASFHFIETPFRTGAVWRWIGSARADLRLASRNLGQALAGQRIPALAVAASAVVAVVAWQARPVTSIDALTANTGFVAPAQAVQANAMADRAQQISDAVHATSFPTFDPSLAALGTNWKATDWRCLSVDAGNVAGCRYAAPSGPHHLAVLLGDSTAISYLAGLSDTLNQRGWDLQSLTYAQCPAVGVPVDEETGSTGFTKVCAEHQQWAFAQLQTLRPALIVLTSAPNTLARLHDHATGQAAQDEWQAAAVTTFKALTGLPWHPAVVDLMASPDIQALTACDTALASPSACVGVVSDQWQRVAAAESTAAKATGVTLIDTHAWFCTADGLCPAFIGATPVRWDTTHLTTKYSRSLVPELTDAIFTSQHVRLPQ